MTPDPCPLLSTLLTPLSTPTHTHASDSWLPQSLWLQDCRALRLWEQLFPLHTLDLDLGGEGQASLTRADRQLQK